MYLTEAFYRCYIYFDVLVPIFNACDLVVELDYENKDRLAGAGTCVVRVHTT